MKQKKLRITQEDFILANRKAARMEEIERHGRQVQSRRMVHKSKKTYDRNRLKRAVIKSDWKNRARETLYSGCLLTLLVTKKRSTKVAIKLTPARVILTGDFFS